MPDLFGLDIAGIVRDAINSAGGVLDGTLRKVTAGTRTTGDLTSGTNPTSTDYAIQGFVDLETDRRLTDSLAVVGGQKVTVLGASLPAGVEPESGDKVVFEGTEFHVNRVLSRDPAAATYALDVTS